jgi:hypothetical protein
MRDMVLGLLDLPGSRYSCVADRESGRILIQFGTAAVDPAVVLRWGMEATTALGTAAEGGLEDFILTSGGHYHLVRPLGETQSLLVYLCVDRARVNLASARRELAAARPNDARAPPPPAPPQRPSPTDAGAPPPTTPPTTPPQRSSPAVSRPAVLPLAAAPPARRGPTNRRPDTVAVPLPRRSGSTAVPALAPASRPQKSSSDPVLAQPWADDVATMNRLLTALRALSNDTNST